VRAFEAFAPAPREAAVYNLGGGRAAHCSMLEAIAMCEAIAQRELLWTLAEAPRIGDHRWWISDACDFRAHYPGWGVQYGVAEILQEIHDENAERWTA
jgi:CDP-paratose 2-epimerase